MITGLQIRAARAGLRISAEELANASNVSSRTIKRMESENSEPASTRANLQAVKAALEAAGIEFIGAPDNGPGIRIYAKPTRNPQEG